MVEKNWLIRTQNKHILGPVSKKKVKDLIDEGFLKSEDELCSGNGFWFFIKESEYLDKYIFGSEVQPFNPVQEAEVLYTEGIEKLLSRQIKTEEKSIDTDLPETPVDDITVTNFDLSKLKEQPEKETKDQSVEIIESAEEKPVAKAKSVKVKTETPLRKKKIVTKQPEVKHVPFFMTYKFMYTLLTVFVLGFLLAIFFRKEILRKIIVNISDYAIPSSIAQEIGKKKSGLNYLSF